MNDSYCGEQIYDCTDKQLSSSYGCVNIVSDSESDIEIKLIHIGVKDVSAPLTQTPFAIKRDISLLDAMIFSLHSDRSSIIEFSRDDSETLNGDCYVYEFSNTPNFGCHSSFSLFYKIIGNSPSARANVFSFIDYPLRSDGVKMTVSVSPDSPIYMERIKTSNFGFKCRQWTISKTLDKTHSTTLQSMGQWCDANKDTDTCQTFCSNSDYVDYCSPYKPYSLYLSLISLLSVVFFTLLTYIKNRSRAELVIGALVSIALGAFVGYELYKYAKYKGYSGKIIDSGNSKSFIKKPNASQGSFAWKYTDSEGKLTYLMFGKNKFTDARDINAILYPNVLQNLAWDQINGVWLIWNNPKSIILFSQTDIDPQNTMLFSNPNYLEGDGSFHTKNNSTFTCTLDNTNLNANCPCSGLTSSSGIPMTRFVKKYFDGKFNSGAGGRDNVPTCTYPQFYDPCVNMCRNPGEQPPALSLGGGKAYEYKVDGNGEPVCHSYFSRDEPYRADYNCQDCGYSGTVIKDKCNDHITDGYNKKYYYCGRDTFGCKGSHEDDDDKGAKCKTMTYATVYSDKCSISPTTTADKIDTRTCWWN